MLKGLELLIIRPNLGQPCLVRNDPKSPEIGFEVLLAGKGDNIDVKSYLDGKLFLQNLHDTREIWQNKYCNKTINVNEFLKNFDISCWPDHIRNKIIPLRVLEWQTLSFSTWFANFHAPLLSCILSIIPNIGQDEILNYNVSSILAHEFTLKEELQKVGMINMLSPSPYFDSFSNFKMPGWGNLVLDFLKYNCLYKASLSFDSKQLDQYQDYLPLLFNLVQNDIISSEDLSRKIFNINFHSIYIHNNKWNKFKFIHATDSHVSLRNDHFFRELFKEGGKGIVLSSGGEDPIGAKKFLLESFDPDRSSNWDQNPNHNFRKFIKKANSLHRKGLLDFIILTGDITDYAYNSRFFSQEKWEPYDNFRLFACMVTGWPISQSVIVEQELEVPIFTVLGNHDYRFREYPIFGVSGFLWIDSFSQKIDEYNKFGLSSDQAFAYMSQENEAVSDYQGEIRPDYSALDGLLFQKHLKMPPNEYLNLINPDKDFVIELENHKIFCLDSGPDEREIEDLIDAAGFGLEWGKLDESRLEMRHTPDSEGLSEEQINLIDSKMNKSSGLRIFALHAPFINFYESPPSRWFRETEHKSMTELDRFQLHKYLSRHQQIRTYKYPIIGIITDKTSTNLTFKAMISDGPIIKFSTDGEGLVTQTFVGFPPGTEIDFYSYFDLKPYLYNFSKDDLIGCFNTFEKKTIEEVEGYVCTGSGYEKIDLSEYYKDWIGNNSFLMDWSLSDTLYFRKGSRDPYDFKKCALGCGVNDKRFDEFMDIIINKAGKKAELILSGHIEKPTEYIVKINGITKEYYHDYYLDNKVLGLSPRLFWNWKQKHDNEAYDKEAPDYANPLSENHDKSRWWLDHSPLHVQNIGLGFPGPNWEDFPIQAGFLVINVDNDSIKNIERLYVVPSIDNSLKKAGRRIGLKGNIKGSDLVTILGRKMPVRMKELIKEAYLFPKFAEGP